ncbi:MAG TPA: hypothetical protein VFZ37_02965 [Jiangellaceae bacterium]
MSIKRVTISVPDDVAAKAARAVEAGHAESVSAYFVGLAEREPDWVEAASVVEAMIADAGGITADDRSWARAVLGTDHGANADAA